MREIESTYKASGMLHHAWLIEGAPELVIPELQHFFDKELNIVSHGNPDVFMNTYDVFGINDGRLLQRLAVQKPIAQRKLFILSFFDITREAQNSLLKLFEEPTPNTHFFLVTPVVSRILPTLRSRVQIVEGSQNLYDTRFVHDFLRHSPHKRITLLKKIIDSKDKVQAQAFLSGLEHELCGAKIERSKEVRELLTDVETFRRLLYNRGSSVKMILEHVSLTAPKIEI